ncbi:hypothetical protein Adt_45024 [Abeliophyllum distichum]|uniref:Uncharacterized protein n=1 Tax=Abeliophyllum distichum TaxID=126358 RepID=A0ABD1PEY4_9LAMI
MEMTVAQGLILNKEVYNTLACFEDKFSKEEAKSKKLAEDLKAMSAEKAKLNSKNGALRFKLDALVATEADLKVKIEAAVEKLKQAQSQEKTGRGYKENGRGS